jgi:uncharacterized protein (TIGR02246 family)
MHRTSFALGASCLLTGICLTFGGDEPAKTSKKADPSPPAKKDSGLIEGTTGAAKKAAKPETKAGSVVAKPETPETPEADEPTADLSPDELAIRTEVEAFLKAYSKGDAKEAASHFTPDAEYVSPRGVVLQGRDAIEASFSAFLKEHPECHAEATIDSIRVVSPGVAMEDGVTTISHDETGRTVQTHYTALHVKIDDKWMVASVRDHDPKSHQIPEEQLSQLDWLKGDWVDEHEHSVVSFSCQPCDKGKFLLRQFSMKTDGAETLSGSQRIGWDPLTRQLRTWIFDSEGGHAEGFWHQDGDSWTLKLTGVTADGETASGTSIYTPINDHTMTWQAVDHVIGGVQMPDGPVYTLVQKLPPPK